jgi:gamma-glutamyl hydrolase
MLSASFAQLSGLVIPGGHCGFHGTAYGAAVAALLQMAERAGDFPVWGTCQGFQQMAQYAATGTATHPSVLHRTGNGTEGIALPLAFADSDPRSTTRLFAGAPARVLTTLATKPVTVNLHHSSLLANESAQHPSLAAYFKVVATNTVDGVEFVSLMEGRTLPWYASQFHGEKNAFEWDQSWCKSPRLDAAEAHSAEAVEAMGYLATVVVAEARKCGHRWAGGVARSLALSYAVQPFATVSSDDAWEQCYLQ